MSQNKCSELPAENRISQLSDDALFESLTKDKVRKKKKRVGIVIAIVVFLLVCGFLGMRVLQYRVRTQFAATAQRVLSAEAVKGTVSTLVSGNGMLVNVDTVSVTVPAGVEITDILVQYGDKVHAGDALAAADMSSVRSAMSALQDNIAALDKQIAYAANDSVGGSINTNIAGRVKKIYAAVGDSVVDVMAEHGCLALLSLDGKMQAVFTAAGFEKGQEVFILRQDGSELPGYVERSAANRVTVIFSDETVLPGEEIEVLSANGSITVKAIADIHTPLAITGYAGTIKSIGIKVNQKLYANSRIFGLTDTGTTANYDALLRTRNEHEETLLELLKIQRGNAVTAPVDGSIYSIAEINDLTAGSVNELAGISRDRQMEARINVGEKDILALELNQKADVTVNSLGSTTIPGYVTEIDKTYSNGAYTALVRFDKTDGMIPGMTASVDIHIEGADNVLLIPTDALHRTSEGYFVYTVYDEENREFGGIKNVVPGLSNNNTVEIKSGISEGEKVYYTAVARRRNSVGFNMSSIFGGSRSSGTGSSSNRTGNSGSGSRSSGSQGRVGG